MIDKRINFRGGGADMGAGASGMGSGNSSGKSGGGGDARDRGMGMAGKTGDYSSGPTGNGGGKDNRFTEFTKDVINPNIDYVGDTVFGPTQKYSGDGIFSGYRNIDPVTGQPLMGASYVADRFKSVFSPSNIIGGILGLINPALGLGFRAVNYLKDEIPETFNQFKDSATLEEFRDKVRGYGRTMPTVSPNPMYGGIESLAVNPQITRDLFAFKPGSVKDRALKQQYGIYNATGMMNPNMIDLMKQDIELNKQKGTPLSLPAEAYSLIG
jgi:hypothetical protein